MMVRRLSLLLLVGLLSLWPSAGVRADQPAAADQALTFEHHIRPILKANCFQCHGEGETLKGKLDLRLRRPIVKRGKSGGAIVVGDPHKSRLYQFVREGKMPRGCKKLKADELELIRRWIHSGAATLRDEPQELGRGHFITEQERALWSFQPIRREALPAVKNKERLSNPIDACDLAVPVGCNATSFEVAR